ncbi:pre-mRNA-processing factor 39-like isoform X2 [Mustelus asterias]
MVTGVMEAAEDPRSEAQPNPPPSAPSGGTEQQSFNKDSLNVSDRRAKRKATAHVAETAVEEAVADCPSPRDGDSGGESAADTPGPSDGDTGEDPAADSTGDTDEESAADSTGDESAADSNGLNDSGEESAADSTGPSDGDTMEGCAADSPGPSDNGSVEGSAADSPRPSDNGSVEGSTADSPHPSENGSAEGSTADSPRPSDNGSAEGSTADSPRPSDNDTTLDTVADSTGPHDGDIGEEATADSPGLCDADTIGQMAVSTPGPCDTDAVMEIDARSPGLCDTDTIERTAARSPGPGDTDTIERTAARSPGPCDTDGVESTAARSPGPGDTDGVESTAAKSPGPCDGNASLRDPNQVAQLAAESPIPSGVQGTAGALSGSPDPPPPCDQGAAVQMEIDGPSVDAEESASECAHLAGGGEPDAAGELTADSSCGAEAQGAGTPLPESSNGPEQVADKALAGSDGAEYGAEGAAAGLDEYGQGSSEYGLVESEDSIPPYPADFEKYWKIVEDNPYDFTGWTYVLQYVEQEVYQRGLQSIPLSVDLWVHYVTYLQEILEASHPETPAKFRSVFEMALAAAGTDFRSDRLWDLYINWEKEQGQLKAVTAIYDRVLSIPTQLYSHHFEKFKEHVQSYSPKDILSTDEFLRLRSEVVTSLTAAEAECDEGPPGDDPPPGVGTTDEEKADTELEKIRAHLVATRQEMYLLNEEEVSKRWNFEEAIKRPYFHVKPLERVQLKNWKDYLDFEISGGTNERVLVLFERCMIACALYEDFWIKYAKYLESHSVEGVRNVFQRACMVHLPKKPTLHLLWAAFEEQQGDLEEARRILKSFQMVVPGLAMVLLRRVSLERRCGHLEQAEGLLREAIEQHRDTALASFFAIKLARQLLKVQKSLVKARKVLLEAVERDKENTKLYLNLLELEFSGDIRINESNILGCFEQVLASSLPLETKIVFSQRRVEFLEDFGCNVQSLLHAYDEHQRLLKQNSSKKRAAENGTEEPDDKKARLDDSSTASAASTASTTTTNSTALVSGDLTSSQAAYNYSAWYQPYGTYGYQNPWNYSQYYPHS